MTTKRFTHIALMLALLLGLVSAISASGEEESADSVGVFDSPALQEATGLDADGLLAALDEGSTPAQLIEAKGGDVDAVIAAMVEEELRHIEAEDDDDEDSEELAELIREWAHGKLNDREADAYFAESAALQEATGLDAKGLLAAFKAGKTAAALIEAKGGDVETVIAAMVEEELRQLREDDEEALREFVEQDVADFVNGTFDDGEWGIVIGGSAVLPILQDATGLDEQGLIEALENGDSLTELIEANGGDVDEVISALVFESLETMHRVESMFVAMDAFISQMMFDAWDFWSPFDWGFGMDPWTAYR